MLKAKGKTFLLEIVLGIVVIVIAGIFAREAFLRFYRSAYPVHYSQLVLEHSAVNELPPALVFAVIRTESGFNPAAISSVEARGLMQITEDTFNWAQMRERTPDELRAETLFDSGVNIRYGTVVLRLLLEEFGSEEMALCAYHAGWGSVKRWLENEKYSSDRVTLDVIPFPDTAYYVDRVLETKEMYERLYTFEQ